MATSPKSEHDFVKAPNRTLFGMVVPVLFSLVAEPITGLVDTAFVARLGVESVAALGIGAVAFSSIFWAFNFLGIGTQTEVAHHRGADDRKRAVEITSLAILLAILIGFLLLICISPLLRPIASLLGGAGIVLDLAQEYTLYRLLGVPAVLVTLACFGSLRGIQDMKTPFWVALGVNVLNIVLDWLLIFGFGSIPALGVAGAAVASSIAQWCGAFGVLIVVRRKLGLSLRVGMADTRKLFAIGGDLFLRTGLVLLFLSLCTRVANQAGPSEGAAYQAIRQFFIFAALFMDAFAITGQSLVGFFLGSGEIGQARRVAVYTCWWSVGTGIALCLGMIVGTGGIAWLLVPPTARDVFDAAWMTCALILPLFSLSCATDGIHWGTGDFRFLRNVMFAACAVAGPLVLLFEYVKMNDILVWIWIGTGVWCGIRSVFGVARITPGMGQAPLRRGARTE